MIKFYTIDYLFILYQSFSHIKEASEHLTLLFYHVVDAFADNKRNFQATDTFLKAKLQMRKYPFSCAMASSLLKMRSSKTLQKTEKIAIP